MKTTIIYLVICLFCNCISGQSYINIGNNTGDNIDEYNSELEDAAAQLISSLPLIYQDSFKVFTLGFYLHGDKFINNGQSIFTSANNYASQNSQYYLLIVRYANEFGLNKYFKVELKLPTDDSLSCLEIGHFGVIASQVKDMIIESNNISPNEYYKAEIAAMNYLSEFVNNKKICCSGQGRMSACGECVSEEELFNFLIDEDFDIIHPEQMNYSVQAASSDLHIQTADINIYFDDDTVNVMNDLYPFISDFDSVLSNAFFDLHYFTQAECNNILQVISVNPFEGQSTPYLYLKVIGFNSFLLGNCLAIKAFTNLKLKHKSGTGTLYYINLDRNVNLDAVIDSSKYFFNIATLSNIHHDKLNQNSICDFGETDGIVIIGENKSKVVYYAFGSESICKSIEEDTHDEMVAWYDEDNKMNPERSPNPLIMISTSDLDPLYINWDNTENTNRLNGFPYRKNRLIGFIVLHGTSHLADFTHDKYDNKRPLGYGYASDADKISEYIKEYNPKWNFEKIISETLKDHLGIIHKTKERFGIH